MIRDNLKIYAEKNSPDTVKTDTILLENKFVIDNGQRQIMSFAPIKALIITDNNGELTWR